MPLKSPSTSRLYSKPLPCHDVSSNICPKRPPRTVTVMSSEFAYHWPECHSHMPAILSEDPPIFRVQTFEEYQSEFQKFQSPRDFISKSKKARADGIRTSPSRTPGSDEGQYLGLFALHDTTHITHSDLGVMFPWLTYWFTGQRNPQLAIRNVVRCILSAAGLQTAEDETPIYDAAAVTQLEQIF